MFAFGVTFLDKDPLCQCDRGAEREQHRRGLQQPLQGLGDSPVVLSNKQPWCPRAQKSALHGAAGPPSTVPGAARLCSCGVSSGAH